MPRVKRSRFVQPPPGSGQGAPTVDRRPTWTLTGHWSAQVGAERVSTQYTSPTGSSTTMSQSSSTSLHTSVAAE